MIKHLVLTSLLFVSAQAANPAPLPKAYVERFADAVYRIEGGEKARKPYGVLSIPVRDKAHARQITINSIQNNWKRWHKAGKPDTFIVFFAKKWCPPSADPVGHRHWVSNARKILNEKWLDFAQIIWNIRIMTYRQLINELSRIPDNRLDDEVTIYDAINDEYSDNVSMKIADEDNYILDEGHVFLKVN